MAVAVSSSAGILQTPATWVGGESDGSGYRGATPPSASANEAVRFAISLNGQDLTADFRPSPSSTSRLAGDASAAPPAAASSSTSATRLRRYDYAPPRWRAGASRERARGRRSRLRHRCNDWSGNPPAGLTVRRPALRHPSPVARPHRHHLGRPVRQLDARRAIAALGSTQTLQTTRPVCTSPNVTTAGRPLEISLNAQDYSAGGGHFCFFNVTEPSFAPMIGPTLGGTRLLTRGLAQPSRTGATPRPTQSPRAADGHICHGPGYLEVPATISAVRSAVIRYTPTKDWGCRRPAQA